MKQRLLFLSLVVMLLGVGIDGWGQTTETYAMSSMGLPNATAVGTSVRNTTDDKITFTFAQNSSTTAPAYYTSGTAVRLYQHETKGGSIKIMVASGYKITSATVSKASGDGDGPVGYAVDGGSEVGSFADGTITNTTGAINATSSVEFYSKGNSSSTRFYVVSFSVTYTSGATTYTVTYDGNGSTGGTAPSDPNSPYASGATVTVLGNTGSLVKTGFTFNNWNTAANGSGTPYAPAATFTIAANTILYAQWVVPEPTNHVSGFSATANSSSQITVNWTDATGGQVPAGYLIKAAIDPSTPTAPSDGTAESDATLVKNIAQGTGTAVFTGLSASTTYNFSIWPYTNSGADINYKTGGSVPSATAITNFASSTSDYFRSKTTGNWNAVGTWESSPNGSDWYDATLTPTSSANTIIILNGHTVTVTASVSVDQVTVNTGGKIIVNSSQTLTIANGADTYDMTVNGSIENAGTITATGAVKFENSGYYKHTRNGGSCIVATWDTNSTCEISGITSTALTNLSQSFGSLIWNCTGQISWIDAALTGSFSVAGNFVISSTGGGSVGINMTTASTNRTYNISGNLSLNGGKLTLVSNNTAIITLNIGGDLIFSASALNQLDFGYGNNNPAGIYRGIINLSGNLLIGTGSILTCTDNGTNDDYGNLVFEKQGSQTFTNNGTLSWIDFDVDNGSTLILNSNLDLGSGQTATKYNGLNVQSGGTLDFNGFNITDNSTGKGTFEAINGGTLLISSANGITTDGSNGNVLVGQAIYNNGANYIYNGNVIQVSGNGLPATVNNLTIDNNLGVKLSNTALTVTGTLLINSGKKLDLEAGKQLSVNGTLTNNAGATGLVIESNATGTGSLIHSTAGVAATVERYIVGHGSVATDGWHLIGSPVATFNIDGSSFDPGANDDIYAWNEATNTWLNHKAGDPTQIVAGTGYIVAYENTAAKTFSGNLNVADVSVSGLAHTAAQGKGWHLLGNPFASALEWNKTGGSWALTNVAGTAKVWNSTTKAYVDLSANGIIPAAQGFFVQVNEGTTGSLTIPAAARAHSSTAWYKNTAPRLILSASPIDGSSSQESQILIENEATNNFDFFYDARFLAGYAPQFYSLCGGEMLSTNVLSEVQNESSIPFGFVKNQNENFVIRLEENNLGQNVYLKDLKHNLTHNLSQETEYYFSSTDGDNPNRFLLHFGAVGVAEQPESAALKAYVVGAQLYFPLQGEATLEIVDLQGRVLQHCKVSGQGLASQPLQLTAGAYVVRLTSGQNAQTAKVIVK